MGLSVRTEVWVKDLIELHEGKVREARMDIVIESSVGSFYLDVTCYHPFSGKGARRTRASGGTPEAQELRKRDRYPVVDPVTRRRRTLATFHPITVSTYGEVGPAAKLLFRQFEDEARSSRARYRIRRSGWLADIVSSVAVHRAAAMVISAAAPPDGQERAHLFGRAAA
jgi:hypothetical protein